MSHICDNLSERRNHDVRLCLCMPFSNVIFLVSRDLKCKWSVVGSRAASQLLRSTKIFLFVGCNESFLPSLGSEASWVVMWRGSFGMAHAAGPCGSADYLKRMSSIHSTCETTMMESLQHYTTWSLNHIPHPVLGRMAHHCDAVSYSLEHSFAVISIEFLLYIENDYFIQIVHWWLVLNSLSVIFTMINFNWQKCLFPSFLHFAPFFQQSEGFSSIIINDKENGKSYILPVNQQLIILVEKLNELTN